MEPTVSETAFAPVNVALLPTCTLWFTVALTPASALAAPPNPHVLVVAALSVFITTAVPMPTIPFSA